MRSARYLLRKHIASFDFLNSLVIAKARRYKEIVFDLHDPRSDKWSEEETLARYESILKPAVALAGLATREGEDGDLMVHSDIRVMVAFSKTHAVEFLRSVLPPGKEKYTVTLRNTARAPSRNSNEEAWRKFAAEIGARVIEDYAVQPMHLHDRAALYSGAEMNFFVTNGPMYLCSMLGAPLMCFACNKDESTWRKAGLNTPCDFPWSTDKQRFIFEDDTYENIVSHFERLHV